jgi:hypothetical protein
MPHYKCVACKTRLYRAASAAHQVRDPCPGCGSLLEPVGELAEVFGFRHVSSRESAADGDAREGVLVQARVDAERWLDDGGSFPAETVAIPGPETNA